jgi:thioredoxin-like negative regulator of GroEL
MWAVSLVLLAAPDDADLALRRAADCLTRDDLPAAIPHLRTYLSANPDDVPVRLHLAESLFRTGDPAARREFERVTADAGPRLADRLPHCHARLMALAEAGGDDYAADLHRGLGLLHLADRWAADPARRDADQTERALTRAAAAFRRAAAGRPNDARANLHLANTLDRLGQPGPARLARATARRGLPDDRLTAADRAVLFRDGRPGR